MARENRAKSGGVYPIIESAHVERIELISKRLDSTQLHVEDVDTILADVVIQIDVMTLIIDFKKISFTDDCAGEMNITHGDKFGPDAKLVEMDHNVGIEKSATSTWTSSVASCSMTRMASRRVMPTYSAYLPVENHLLRSA